MTDRLDLELKVGTVDDSGTFEGFASVFNEVDQVGDVVAPGAFRKSLAAHQAAGRLPLLLWMHRPDEPIGVWESIVETAHGLAVKGRLILDTARGREAYALLKEKALTGLSIGFRTLKSARTKTGRLLQELDLAEISLVSFPALASARVTSVKSHAARRRIPSKDPSDMALDLSLPDDGAPEVAAALPPEILSRIEELETRSAKIDGLTDQLDKVLTRLSRPAARIEVRQDDAELERRAFDSFLRKGADRMPEAERKTLSTIVGSPDDGGFQLVPQTFLTELQRNLVEVSPMRQVARVTPVGGTPVVLPKRTANLSGGWVAETVEDGLSEPSYRQQSVDVFEARVSVEVSNQLLEDSAFNLAAELSRDLAEEFARLEGVAFVSGNGTTAPEGFTVSADFTTTEGSSLDADDIIDLYHAIPSVYASRGTWLMRRATIGSVRKLKTSGTGVYLWSDSLQPGNPPSLLGRPVVEMPDMEGAGSPSDLAIAFGDWMRAYRIFDRVGLEILRDPYTKARNSIVCFHARKRVGGALVDGAAVKGLLVAS
jgi:HK97 family phage major capsid protein/HK97 family phage prohead protease